MGQLDLSAVIQAMASISLQRMFLLIDYLKQILLGRAF
jgi:hypothetical protein